jgi:hypothetical protein
MKTPYEQGRADSYYGRPFILARGDWTADQLDEYRAGYEQNEQDGHFKEIRPGYSTEGEEECMQ